MSASVERPSKALEIAIRCLYDVPEDARIESLEEPKRTYVEYALGTIERGRGVMAELHAIGLPVGFRYLDAGCAYGGFVVAAAEAGASEVIGVDLDDRFLPIARELASSLAVPARIESGDLCDEELVDRIGPCDVVTCADVIEHVEDPQRAMANLSRLVRPGGLLYVAIPNARSPMWVRKDPHYQLFAITLLNSGDAREYYRQVTGCDHYDVGSFLTRGEYEQMLRREGLQAVLINVPSGSATAICRELEVECQELRSTAHAFLQPKLSRALQELVRSRAIAWARELDHRLDLQRAWSRCWPPRARREAARIVRDYAIPTWHFLARRRA